MKKTTKPRYSAKIAGGRTLIGVAVSLLPAVIAWVVAKGYLSEVDAAFAAVLVGAISAALGVDYDAFRTAKRNAENADA